MQKPFLVFFLYSSPDFYSRFIIGPSKSYYSTEPLWSYHLSHFLHGLI